MELYLNIAIFISLLGIIWEDFHQRLVHIGWLLSFILLAAVASILENGEWIIQDWWLTNAIFLLFQMIVLTLYFSVKNKTFTNITTNYLGWGDIVFFIGLIFLMPPITFIWFYTLSLIIVLIGFIFSQKILNLKIKTIPLAGGVAICLILLLIFRNI